MLEPGQPGPKAHVFWAPLAKETHVSKGQFMPQGQAVRAWGPGSRVEQAGFTEEVGRAGEAGRTGADQATRLACGRIDPLSGPSALSVAPGSQGLSLPRPQIVF